MALFEKHRGLWRGLRPARDASSPGRPGPEQAARPGSAGDPRDAHDEHVERRRDGQQLVRHANWDMLPTAGSDLVFPSNAVSQVSTNDLTPGTIFTSLTVTSAAASGQYTIGGNAIALTGVLEDSSPSGVVDTLGLPIELDGPATVTVDHTGATLLAQGRSRERAG